MGWIAESSRWSLLVLVVSSLGCGSRKAGPPAPTAPQPTNSPPPQTYSITGVVTEYRGGPVPGVTVRAYPNLIAPGLTWTTTETDEQGRYSLAGLSGSMVLEVWRDGYTSARKYHLPVQDQSVSLVLHPRFDATVDGEREGTIWGDEFVASADELGGYCTHTACKVVQFDGCYGGHAEIRLRWSDPASQLALYLPQGEVYLPIGLMGSVQRLCCASELVSVYTFNGDCTDYFAIGFEQAAGREAGPGDSQVFELTVRRIP